MYSNQLTNKENTEYLFNKTCLTIHTSHGKKVEVPLLLLLAILYTFLYNNYCFMGITDGYISY